MRRLLSVLLLAFAVPALLPVMAQAQPYPSQLVKIVVGYPAGGTTDVVARLIAEALTERLGRTVIVENRPGASATLATDAVAKATPDGYTLLVASSAHATLRELFPKVSFDPVDSFAPIALMAKTPYILVVPPELPVRTLPELVALAKSKPSELAYASSGMGTGQHLGGELFRRVAGIDILHVPYKGSSAITSDLLSGRIQMMFENVAIMLPQMQRGALRGLAITSPERSPLAADIPTLRELGFAAAEVEGWFALLAPARTPPEIVLQLNAAVNATLRSDAVRERLASLGAVPVGGTPQEAADFIRSEREKWGRVIREANIQVE
jgi:tripartite-type tricarboxylate transporter receptor subunit TctC